MFPQGPATDERHVIRGKDEWQTIRTIRTGFFCPSPLLTLSNPQKRWCEISWYIFGWRTRNISEYVFVCVYIYIYLSLFDEVACSIFIAVTTSELCVERKWCHVVNSSLCHTKLEAWVIKKIFTAFNYSMFKMWSRNKELFVALIKGNEGEREKEKDIHERKHRLKHALTYFNEKKLNLSRSPGWSEEMCIRRAHFVSASKQSY